MILPAVTQLLIIQDRDRKLRQLKTELKNAPIERKALEGKLAGTSAALDAAKLKAKEIEVQRKALENQVGSINERIIKFEQQKLAIKAKQGRPVYGVDIKIVDADGKELPHDGKAFGDLRVVEAAFISQLPLHVGANAAPGASQVP